MLCQYKAHLVWNDVDKSIQFPFVCNKCIDCIQYFIFIRLTILLLCTGKYINMFTALYRCTNRFNDVHKFHYKKVNTSEKYFMWAYNIKSGKIYCRRPFSIFVVQQTFDDIGTLFFQDILFNILYYDRAGNSIHIPIGIYT